MKKLLLLIMMCISLNSEAQRDVRVTRTTHLLKVPNQATFNHELTVPAGDGVFLFAYSKDGYYKVRYKYHDYFVYYPYLDGIEFAADLKDEVLTGGANIHGIKKLPKSQNKAYSAPAPSRVIHTGPRGGRYYINKNGNKTYIKH